MISLSLLSNRRQPPWKHWSEERLNREQAIALGYIINPRTRLAYSSHLLSYLSFCKHHKFPIEPTPDTLSFYTVYMCHHIKPKSVSSYLSGICHELEKFFPSVCAAWRSTLVSRTLKGCLRLYNTPTIWKCPLTVEDLLQLKSAYSLPSHDNLLFITSLFSRFFALHRLGELTVPDDHRLIDSQKIITRASVKILHIGYQYTLPSHKGDPTFEGCDIVVASREDNLDLFSPFQAYLNSCDQLFPFHP